MPLEIPLAPHYTTSDYVTMLVPGGVLVINIKTGTGYRVPEMGDGVIPIKGAEKQVKTAATAVSILAATEDMKEYATVRKEAFKNLKTAMTAIEAKTKPL